MDHKVELKDFIDTIMRENGSDLHLSEGRNPVVRVTGALIPLVKKDVLTKRRCDKFFINPHN